MPDSPEAEAKSPRSGSPTVPNTAPSRRFSSASVSGAVSSLPEASALLLLLLLPPPPPTAAAAAAAAQRRL